MYMYICMTVRIRITINNITYVISMVRNPDIYVGTYYLLPSVRTIRTNLGD